MTPRFFRHFNMLNVPPPSNASMKTILSSITAGSQGPGGFLGDFPRLLWLTRR